MGGIEVSERLYLIWSGKRQAWWRPNRMGYTFSTKEAGRYGAEEAADIVSQCAFAPLKLRNTLVPADQAVDTEWMRERSA